MTYSLDKPCQGPHDRPNPQHGFYRSLTMLFVFSMSLTQLAWAMDKSRGHQGGYVEGSRPVFGGRTVPGGPPGPMGFGFMEAASASSNPPNHGKEEEQGQAGEEPRFTINYLESEKIKNHFRELLLEAQSEGEAIRILNEEETATRMSMMKKFYESELLECPESSEPRRIVAKEFLANLDPEEKNPGFNDLKQIVKTSVESASSDLSLRIQEGLFWRGWTISFAEAGAGLILTLWDFDHDNCPWERSMKPRRDSDIVKKMWNGFFGTSLPNGSVYTASTTHKAGPYNWPMLPWMPGDGECGADKKHYPNICMSSKTITISKALSFEDFSEGCSFGDFFGSSKDEKKKKTQEEKIAEKTAELEDTAAKMPDKLRNLGRALVKMMEEEGCSKQSRNEMQAELAKEIGEALSEESISEWKAEQMAIFGKYL